MKEREFKQLVNSITPDISKAKLQALIASLPNSVRIVKHVYRGNQMLKMGFETDEKGRAIRKGGVYHYDEFTDVNTRKEVMRAWKRNRDVAVKKYLTLWLKNHLEMMPKAHLFDDRYKFKKLSVTRIK